MTTRLSRQEHRGEWRIAVTRPAGKFEEVIVDVKVSDLAGCEIHPALEGLPFWASLEILDAGPRWASIRAYDNLVISHGRVIIAKVPVRWIKQDYKARRLTIFARGWRKSTEEAA